ncbi:MULTISPECIES: GDSL-type esterase/lipase family protein [unclassified Pseudonocardia]|uniref:GDSL-type esterase/lipase family protein n=1 Tax=unclassified Pseudonocardia TaxID=2619320 RepID=UPI00094AB9E9|nr:MULTISPECIES: GDSL-type esterase/lipase family protein [unclassified Pseudonocardia]
MSPAWTASWTQAVTDVGVADLELRDVTVRIVVEAGVGGDRLRVSLSNRFGTAPLHIGRAAVRVAGRAGPMRFGGQPAVEVPAGEDLTCDPVDLAVLAGDTVEVDLYLPDTWRYATANVSTATWRPSAPGNHAGADEFPGRDTPVLALPDGSEMDLPAPLLRGVDVLRTVPAPVVVCLGDSITAAGWPERTARRLRDRQVAVVNRGIAGNRLRLDGAGPFGPLFGAAGRTRFDRDVLATAGRTHLVVALGVNDLGHPGTMAPADQLPTAGQLIRALDGIASRADDAGLPVVLATLTPFDGAEGFDRRRELCRAEVNAWIRGPGSGRTVVDFDAALSAGPGSVALDPRFDSGDHLHPGDEGLDRMAVAAAEVLGRLV